MDAGWNDPLVVAREALIRAGVLETMAMDGMNEEQVKAFQARYDELSKKLRADITSGLVAVSPR
jgi:hypothetical protein